MSQSTERKKASDTLASYSLMGVSQLAGFIGCSERKARALMEEWGAKIGGEWKADPVDVAIRWLALREGMTPERFRHQHGQDAIRRAWEFIDERGRRAA